MTPVTFQGLEVSVYKNQAGGLTERWAAEAIADIQQRPGQKTDNTSSSGSGSSSSSGSSSKSSSSSSSAAA